MARFVKLIPKLDFKDPHLSLDTTYTVLKEGEEWTEFEDMIQIRFGSKQKEIGWFWDERFVDVDEKDLNVSEHLTIIKEETKKKRIKE
jgi:hypothetical protein